MDVLQALGHAIYYRLTQDPTLQQIMGGNVRMRLVWAQPDEPFPYLVYRLDMAPVDSSGMSRATLWLDLWDMGSTATRIYQMRSRVVELLEGWVFDTSGGEARSARLRLDSSGFVPEEAPDIWHMATLWTIRFWRAEAVKA